MNRVRRQLEEFHTTFCSDPFKLAQVCGLNPSDQQAELFTAVLDAEAGRAPPRIAAKSGQGVGKSSASFIVALNRLLKTENANVIVTSPTMRQCKRWLTEASLWLDKCPPVLRNLVKATKSKIMVAGSDKWSIELVTATKTEAAQGIHRPGLTVIMDEFSGIPRPLVEQYEGTISNEDPLMIGLGNPNTRDCAMFDSFNRFRHLWQTFTWNAELSPNVNKANLAYLAEKYGIDSDVYRIRVKGEFPHQDPKCIMSSEDLEKCLKVPLYSAIKVPRMLNGLFMPAHQIASDFARYGGDENVSYRRLGEAIVEQMIESHMDPADMVEASFRMQTEAHWTNGQTWYVVDITGMGEGVVHKYYRAQKNVLEFRTLRSPTDNQYDNIATQAWFELGAKVRAHTMKLPNDNKLFQQLSTRQYTTTKEGKLILETKDHYMDRGFDSPDRGDTAVMVSFDNGLVASKIATPERMPRRARIIH